MDALSDVLRAVRLTGAVFFDVAAAPPWVAEAPPGSAIVGDIFPGADHLISFHVVTRGSCWGSLIGGTGTELRTGDIIVFPHGDPHIMSSAHGMRGVPELDDYRRRPDRTIPFSLVLGSGEPATAHVVCGFLGCDARPFNPLLASLPRVLHQSHRPDSPLMHLLQLAVEESRERRVGSDALLGRLSELLFVDVVRRHLDSLPDDRAGWLAGLRDRAVGQALASLHTDPSRDWTLELLAHEVGVSRSSLADRFTSLVGQPPMQYLAAWRMQHAASLLVGSTDSVAAVAARVGYESEAAFSRAFKKIVGMSPGAWKRVKSASVARATSTGADAAL